MKKGSFYQQKPEGAQVSNWREHDLGDSLFYSRRATHYRAHNFPSALHYHHYYELVIFEAGEIEYLCEKACYRPRAGEILLIPPGAFHMSRILGEETDYKRHVFYLYPDGLDFLGCGALLGFLEAAGEGMVARAPKEPERLLALLHQLDEALLAKEPTLFARAKGLLIEIFFQINQSSFADGATLAPLPENVLAIKGYIEQNFREITSAKEVAAHFFYSREYVARLFRRYFNTTVSEYIKARRIHYCQSLIEEGHPLSEVCFMAGFENLSTFIRAFRSIHQMPPSEYKKSLKNVR